MIPGRSVELWKRHRSPLKASRTTYQKESNHEGHEGHEEGGRRAFESHDRLGLNLPRRLRRLDHPIQMERNKRLEIELKSFAERQKRLTWVKRQRHRGHEVEAALLCVPSVFLFSSARVLSASGHEKPVCNHTTKVPKRSFGGS